MTTAAPHVERCWVCKEDTDEPALIAFAAMMSGPGWLFYGCPPCIASQRIIPCDNQADDGLYGSLQYEPT